MYEVDSIDAAQEAADQLGIEPRVAHFYDPGQLLGQAIAEKLGAEPGKVAWDIYLFYDREEVWDDRVPRPMYWAHQLLGSSWANPSRLHRGDELTRRLQEIMEELTRGGRAA